ncbi:MAG: NUDIX domain-containing protein [Bacteroidetes bacterium]|nr:NUDIX domain-containing protein [Bacteroidota bacterium]
MDIENGHEITYRYEKEDKVLVAVDCIIFGFDGEDLKILLIKRGFEPEKGKWSLVGGFLKKEETLETAATRLLEHYTGLENIYMEQVATFSEVDRDPVERTITTAYYALINIQEHSKNLIHQFSAKWFSASKAPHLIFDHDAMVQHALQRLRHRAATEPIGFDLLPEKFTMLQLQKLYEAIWDTQFDKRNFINKINSLNIIDKLDEKDMTTSRKGSFLYQFNAEKHKQQNGKLLI